MAGRRKKSPKKSCRPPASFGARLMAAAHWHKKDPTKYPSPERLFDDCLLSSGPSNSVMLDPRKIGVDPERFQFKLDVTDEDSGTGKALKGVKKWDPIKADRILAWQDKAGKYWVADGHHRVALACRLKVPRIEAFVLRARDGYSAADARAAAALRNLAAGRGTAIDAAKLFRDSDFSAEKLEEEGVPLSELVVQRGLQMRRLTPEVFRMVVHRQLQPDHAAIIGELLPDDEVRQRAVARWLVDHPMRSQQEVRAFTRQVKPTSTRQEATLFGTETIRELLLDEKAKILSAALSILRRDKTTFRRLGEAADRIEAAGNQLDRETNRDIAQDADELMIRIKKLAHLRGPIADLLNEQARRLREEPQRRKELARQFLQGVSTVGLDEYLWRNPQRGLFGSDPAHADGYRFGQYLHYGPLGLKVRFVKPAPGGRVVVADDSDAEFELEVDPSWLTRRGEQPRTAAEFKRQLGPVAWFNLQAIRAHRDHQLRIGAAKPQRFDIYHRERELRRRDERQRSRFRRSQEQQQGLFGAAPRSPQGELFNPDEQQWSRFEENIAGTYLLDWHADNATSTRHGTLQTAIDWLQLHKGMSRKEAAKEIWQRLHQLANVTQSEKTRRKARADRGWVAKTYKPHAYQQNPHPDDRRSRSVLSTQTHRLWLVVEQRRSGGPHIVHIADADADALRWIAGQEPRPDNSGRGFPQRHYEVWALQPDRYHPPQLGPVADRLYGTHWEVASFRPDQAQRALQWIEDQKVENPDGYPALPLSLVRAFEPLAEEWSVSRVARSPGGFLTAWKQAGTFDRLSKSWKRKRWRFLRRHLAQARKRDESLWRRPSGSAVRLPTRRHLALIMWGYSPARPHELVAAARSLGNPHRSAGPAGELEEAAAKEYRRLFDREPTGAEFEAWVDAYTAYRRHHGAKAPIRVREVELSREDLPRFLPALGDLDAMTYRTPKGSSLEGYLMRHRAGDHGRGRRKSRPPLIAWDPRTGEPIIVGPDFRVVPGRGLTG